MRKLAFILSGFIFYSFATFPSADDQRMTSFLLEHLAIKYQKHKFDSFIYVAIKRQKLYFIKADRVQSSYSISTSKFGTGFLLNSEQTPLGLHRISHKTGDKTPLGGIIKGVDFTGKMAKIETEPVETGKDEVTTRAIRLEGFEPGINKGGKKDSFNREIYIHGTPEEGLIGTPASHGCVRMKNLDIIELFNSVKEGTFVVILNN